MECLFGIFHPPVTYSIVYYLCSNSKSQNVNDWRRFIFSEEYSIDRERSENLGKKYRSRCQLLPFAVWLMKSKNQVFKTGNDCYIDHFKVDFLKANQYSRLACQLCQLKYIRISFRESQERITPKYLHLVYDSMPIRNH